MVVLRQEAQNYFFIESFTGYGGSYPYEETVISAINSLFDNPKIASFFTSGLGALMPASQGDTRFHVGPDSVFTGTGGTPNAYYQSSNVSPSGFHYIGLSSSIIQSGIGVTNVDGSNFAISLARTIFHEIAHSVFSQENEAWAFREEPAIFLENLMFSTSRADERMGHDGTTTTASVSSTGYLADFTYAGWDENPNPLTTDALGGIAISLSRGNDSLIKTFWSTNTDNIDHLITTRLHVDAGFISSTGGISSSTMTSLIESSAVEDGTDRILAFHNAQADISSLLDSAASSTNPNAILGWIGEMRSALITDFEVKSAMMVSAERYKGDLVRPNGTFTASRSYSGPVEHDPQFGSPVAHSPSR